MTMTNKVHRDCGSEDFEQRRPAQLKATMAYDERCGWYDVSEIIEDADRDEEIVCAECGDEVGPDDLITQDEYDACEHTDSEDGYCLNCAEYVGPEADDFEVDR